MLTAAVIPATTARRRLTLEPYEDAKDPFTDPSRQMNTYNTLKLFIPGLLFIPLRLATIIGFFTMTTSVIKLANWGVTEEDATNADGTTIPLRGWRRSLSQWGLRIGCRALLMGFGFIKVDIIGKPDPRASVVVSNHMGSFEAFAISFATGACFIAATENRQIPFIAGILDGTQAIFVDRFSPASREDAIKEIRRRAKAVGDGWPPLVIFPEGTTHSGRTLLQFKQGAFQPGVPIQPVIARFQYKHMDISWSGVTEHITKGFLRVTSQWYNSMSIEYLPIYFPTEAEQQNAQMYADHVRRYMSDKSGIPCSKYSTDDLEVLKYAAKFGIAQEDALVGMDLLRREAHLSINDIKKFINLFRELGADRKGKVSYESFIAALELPDTKLAQETFHKLHEHPDDSGCGTFSSTPLVFRDFLSTVGWVVDVGGNPTMEYNSVVKQLLNRGCLLNL